MDTPKKRTSPGSGRKKTTTEEKLNKIPFDIEKIEKIAYFGASDTQLGDILGVDQRTIDNWKKDLAFLSALKRGKEKADKSVVKSLYQRATGYSHEAVKIFMPAGATQPIYAPYTEHYPPDPTAMIFWLKNRDKENWRDRHDVTSDGEKITSVKVVVVKSKRV
jgi:hypothetical protein